LEIESVVENKSMQLLLKALHFGASDVHLVPQQDKYTIHFRKYGKLFPSSHIPIELGDRIISFFKFLSSLDISERRKPQSGAFQKEFLNQLYAFRVSTLPSIFLRESVVIRILAQNARLPISSISLNPNSAEKLIQLVSSGQGLLLFCGATGSGKTTSLYSLVNYVSEMLARHVISLEDPVESNQSNLLQIQVNERAGVTYATGLKAILRHSPDVIMIGEIRESETAKIAIEAALSGHLVLSTIHAKDTVNCIYRLLDFDISLDEIRQALIGIVAQCLVQVGEERKALYEILSDVNLNEAIVATMRREQYLLPHSERLTSQLASFEVRKRNASTTF